LSYSSSLVSGIKINVFQPFTPTVSEISVRDTNLTVQTQMSTSNSYILQVDKFISPTTTTNFIYRLLNQNNQIMYQAQSTQSSVLIPSSLVPRELTTSLTYSFQVTAFSTSDGSSRQFCPNTASKTITMSQFSLGSTSVETYTSNEINNINMQSTDSNTVLSQYQSVLAVFNSPTDKTSSQRKTLYQTLISNFYTQIQTFATNGLKIDSFVLTIASSFGNNNIDSNDASFSTRKNLLNYLSNNFSPQRDSITSSLDNFSKFYLSSLTQKGATATQADNLQLSNNMKTFLNKVSSVMNIGESFSSTSTDANIKLTRLSSTSAQTPEIQTDSQSTFKPNGQLSTSTIQDIQMISYLINPFIFSTTKNITANQSRTIDISVYDGTTSQLLEVKNLATPMLITIKDSRINENSTCKYYDTVNDIWREDGMGLVSATQGTIVCNTTHLTSFSVFDNTKIVISIPITSENLLLLLLLLLLLIPLFIVIIVIVVLIIIILVVIAIFGIGIFKKFSGKTTTTTSKFTGGNNKYDIEMQDLGI
jgi:hypothetical protein